MVGTANKSLFDRVYYASAFGISRIRITPRTSQDRYRTIDACSSTTPKPACWPARTRLDHQIGMCGLRCHTAVNVRPGAVSSLRNSSELIMQKKRPTTPRCTPPSNHNAAWDSVAVQWSSLHGRLSRAQPSECEVLEISGQARYTFLNALYFRFLNNYHQEWPYERYEGVGKHSIHRTRL